MTSSISLKAHCGSSIKRQLINNPQLTYNELCFTLHRMFQPLLSNNLENLILRYVDQDGDFICLETDDDLLTALTFGSNLHIHVFDKETVPFKDGSIQQLDLRHLSLSEKNMHSLISYLTHVQEKIQGLIQALIQTQSKSKNLKSLTENDISTLLNQLEITPPSQSTNASTPGINSIVPQRSEAQAQSNATTENTDSLLHSAPVEYPQVHPPQPPQQQQQYPQTLTNTVLPPSPSNSYPTPSNPPPSTAMYTNHTTSSQSYHHLPSHYPPHPSMMTQQHPPPPSSLPTNSTPQPYAHPQTFAHPPHPHAYTPHPMYLNSTAPSTATPEHPVYALGAYRAHPTPSSSSSSTPPPSSSSSSSSTSSMSVTHHPNASSLTTTHPPTPSLSMTPNTSVPQGAHPPYYSTSDYRKY